MSFSDIEQEDKMGKIVEWIPVVLGLAALAFAAYLIRKVKKAEAGTDRMKDCRLYP